MLFIVIYLNKEKRGSIVIVFVIVIVIVCIISK